MSQIYNIYCDESRVENPDSNKMVIGALFLLRSKKRKTLNELKSIFQKHSFNYELKWSKVGGMYFDLYKDIIDYFLKNNLLSFRGIIVDKRIIKLDEYHDGDLELAFFKFYYFMLKAKLMSDNEYYIFLDKKPTRDRNIVRALKTYLDSYIIGNKVDCKIRHFQSYDSDENIFIQLADFFTGLLGFSCNDIDLINSQKYKIVEYFKTKICKDDLCTTSFLKENKFNIFVWKESSCKKLN